MDATSLLPASRIASATSPACGLPDDSVSTPNRLGPRKPLRLAAWSIRATDSAAATPRCRGGLLRRAAQAAALQDAADGVAAEPAVREVASAVDPAERRAVAEFCQISRRDWRSLARGGLRRVWMLVGMVGRTGWTAFPDDLD